MIGSIQKVPTSLDRNLKNIIFALYFYGGMFLFSVVFFGFMGIIPLVASIKAKTALVREMQQSNKIMQTNIPLLQRADSDLKDNAEGADYLNRYMPVVTFVQDFMLDLVEDLSREDYLVRYFSQEDLNLGGGQVAISVSLEGSKYPHNLVSRIEDLKRVTQVKRITITNKEDGTYDINLLLIIYNLVRE